MIADPRPSWIAPSFKDVLPLIALAAIVAFVVADKSQYVGAQIALESYAPSGWIAQISHPEAFLRDFPSALNAYGKSLFMHLYRLLHAVFGLMDEPLVLTGIAIEMLALGTAMLYLIRGLFPGIGVVPQVLTLLLVLMGRARGLSLARFGDVYFWGLFYNVADAARLVAIGAWLRGRWTLAGACLGLSFACHPIFGLVGTGFLAAASLVRRPERKEALRALVALGLTAGVWVASQFDPARISGGGIPNEEWFRFSRYFSYHWYPIDLGLFRQEFHQELMPLLGFCVLLTAYLRRLAEDGRARDVRAWLAGSSALLLLTGLGLLHSLSPLSPMVVKLCLQRAGDLLPLVGIPVIVAGMWQEWRSGNWFWGALAGAVLAHAVLLEGMAPWRITLLFAARECFVFIRGRRGLESRVALVCSLLFSGVCAYFYWLTPYWKVYAQMAYDGPENLLNFFYVLLAARFAFQLFAPAMVPASGLVLVAFVAWEAYGWQVAQRPDREAQLRGESYREAQLWAREHTPRGAVFFIDPAEGYAWRELSHRSSFGTVREWLYAGWIYESDRRVLDEGLRRYALFGLPLPESPSDGKFDAGQSLMRQVEGAYATFGDDWLRRLGAEFAVDYLVTRRQRSIASSNAFPVVFENAYYRILDLSAARPVTPGAR